MAGSDLVPVSYISGTAASIVVVLGGVRSYNARQRKRWTDEGARVQRNNEALDANTKAAAANTAAIGELMRKLDSFAQEVRAELSGHDSRLARIEDVIEGPLRTRRKDPIQ